MKRFFLDKRGKEDILFPVVIFLIINLIFFSALLGFVLRASSSALIYEQAYAKEIALIIDNAKPGTEISFDFSNGYEIAGKNNFGGESLGELVKIKDNGVIVSLSKSGGYSFDFFSSHEVEIGFLKKQNQIVVKVK